MIYNKSEVAIILILQIKQLRQTPVRYPGILAGVHGKITIESDNYGPESVV